MRGCIIMNKLRWLILAGLVLWLPSAALAGEEGSSNAFYFGDVGQAVVTLTIFLLLFFVLGKYAWKPLTAQLEKREKSIQETIEQAQKRQKDAEALLAEYRSRLDMAQAEVAELLVSGRAEAASARETVLAAAQQEAHRAGQQAREEIERAKRDALNEMYDATASLAADVAGKLIRKNLTSDDQKRLLQDSLQEVRKIGLS